MFTHARRVIGLSGDEFWSLTMREYSRECAAARGRTLDGYNRDVMQAWKTIALLGEGLSKTGLRGLNAHLIREHADTPISRARERLAWQAFETSHGLTQRPISKAGREALRRLKADQARLQAMAEEAISSALKN